MTQIPVTLNPRARAFYDEVEGLARDRVQAGIEANGGITQAVRCPIARIVCAAHQRPSAPQVQSNALSMITRLRQIALHPALVPAAYLEQLRHASEQADAGHAPTTLTPDDRVRLQRILAQAIEDSEECPVCFSPLGVDPRITGCAHWYCLDW
jgi:SWI/SNF-related matrix-associated actin-dependent regulator of chromatin subfamily A3